MTYIQPKPIEPNPAATVTEITPADLPAVAVMIDDLAEYEQVTGPVRSTVESLHAVMFGSAPSLFGFISRIEDAPAGIILGFEIYSVISKRFAKRQRMQWTKRGAHLLLQIWTRTLGGTLRSLFERWQLGVANDNTVATVQAAAA